MRLRNRKALLRVRVGLRGPTLGSLACRGPVPSQQGHFHCRFQTLLLGQPQPTKVELEVTPEATQSNL